MSGVGVGERERESARATREERERERERERDEAVTTLRRMTTNRWHVCLRSETVGVMSTSPASGWQEASLRSLLLSSARSLRSLSSLRSLRSLRRSLRSRRAWRTASCCAGRGARPERSGGTRTPLEEGGGWGLRSRRGERRSRESRTPSRLDHAPPNIAGRCMAARSATCPSEGS